MADIEKISVGGTSYDVRDANAAHALADIAVAGSNISFEPYGTNNVTTVGSITTTGTSLSNFSSSNYATAQFTPEEVPFAWKAVVKVTSGSTTTGIQRAMVVYGLCMMHFNNGKLHFEPAGLSDYTSNITVSSNTTYYMSIEFNGTDTYTYSYSNDGNAWTTITTATGSFSPAYTNESTIYLGQEPALGSHYFRGSIDLQGCYLEINGVKVWEGFVQTGKTKINATGSSITVDQTYNSASSNPQSGVAINGAGFLKNSATGSNSLTILGNATGYENSVNIGAGSRAGSSGNTAIGYNAQTEYSNGVAVGYEAYASGRAVCIGHPTASINGRKGACNTNTIAIGESTAAKSEDIAIGVATAYGSNSIAIGRASATANFAIQLGCGTNSTANTFSVGLGVQQPSKNYRLLNSDGTIPGERMALQGTEAPTTATVGSVGQFYVDTTNQIGYMCVSTADSTYVWKQITA